MVKIIKEVGEIRKAQAKFEKAFEKFLNKKVDAFIGYKGERWKTALNWSDELGLWAVFNQIEGNRFWNAFGLKEPEKGSSCPIVAEINFPLAGVNRRVAGVFVKDEKGNIIVCHRGRIGGSRPGIGKTLFDENYRGEWVVVNDGEEENEFAIIGDISSPRFPYQVHEFVLEVDRIKKIADKGFKKDVPKAEIGFAPEFYREKRFKIDKEVISNCDHGYVVGELARTLESNGLRVGNDQLRDLYIIEKSKHVSAIFEVKTELTLNNLYTGIGQLFLNSVGLPKKPRLFLVLPENPPKTVETKLKEVGIECLTYKMTGKSVKFPDIKVIDVKK